MSTKKKILRSFSIVVFIIALFVLGYYILVWTGVWESVNTVEKMKEFILGFGFYGRLAFVFIQFLILIH